MPSYEKNKSSGLWSVRFRESLPGEGTHQKRLSGFKTKKDAQYGYEDYITERQKKLEEQAQNKIIEQSPDEMLFDRVAQLYLEYKKPRIKETSYPDLESKLNNRVLSFFTGMKLSEISPSTIITWQNSLNNYSHEYQRKLNELLNSVYKFGEKYYNIKNITKNIDRPRNLEPKKEMQFYSPEEFAKFVSCVDNEQYKQLFKFLFITGCRRGEACSLTWQDIDFNTNTINICKSVSYKVKRDGKPYIITTPKNYGSFRKITLPPFYVEELKEYKQWQKDNFKCTDFVFGSTDPLPPTSISRSLFKAAEKANLKQIRVHDLRHSNVSYLIHEGISIVAISRRLGHSDIEETLNTYSHMLPDDQTMIINSLNTLSALF